MSSVLNSASSTFVNSTQNVTYDLTTQEGRYSFWNFILSIIPATIYPGIVACYWSYEDRVKITLPDNTTYRITGESQIWLHGIVQENVPSSWNSISLCIIDVTTGRIITLRLDYAGTSEIRLFYSLYNED